MLADRLEQRPPSPPSAGRASPRREPASRAARRASANAAPPSTAAAASSASPRRPATAATGAPRRARPPATTRPERQAGGEGEEDEVPRMAARGAATGRAEPARRARRHTRDLLPQRARGASRRCPGPRRAPRPTRSRRAARGTSRIAAAMPGPMPSSSSSCSSVAVLRSSGWPAAGAAPPPRPPRPRRARPQRHEHLPAVLELGGQVQRRQVGPATRAARRGGPRRPPATPRASRYTPGRRTAPATCTTSRAPPLRRPRPTWMGAAAGGGLSRDGGSARPAAPRPAGRAPRGTARGGGCRAHPATLGGAGRRISPDL